MRHAPALARQGVRGGKRTACKSHCALLLLAYCLVMRVSSHWDFAAAACPWQQPGQHMFAYFLKCNSTHTCRKFTTILCLATAAVVFLQAVCVKLLGRLQAVRDLHTFVAPSAAECNHSCALRDMPRLAAVESSSGAPVRQGWAWSI